MFNKRKMITKLYIMTYFDDHQNFQRFNKYSSATKLLRIMKFMLQQSTLIRLYITQYKIIQPLQICFKFEIEHHMICFIIFNSFVTRNKAIIRYETQYFL